MHPNASTQRSCDHAAVMFDRLFSSVSKFAVYSGYEQPSISYLRDAILNPLCGVDLASRPTKPHHGPDMARIEVPIPTAGIDAWVLHRFSSDEMRRVGNPLIRWFHRASQRATEVSAEFNSEQVHLARDCNTAPLRFPIPVPSASEVRPHHASIVSQWGMHFSHTMDQNAHVHLALDETGRILPHSGRRLLFALVGTNSDGTSTFSVDGAWLGTHFSFKAGSLVLIHIDQCAGEAGAVHQFKASDTHTAPTGRSPGTMVLSSHVRDTVAPTNPIGVGTMDFNSRWLPPADVMHLKSARGHGNPHLSVHGDPNAV